MKTKTRLTESLNIDFKSKNPAKQCDTPDNEPCDADRIYNVQQLYTQLKVFKPYTDLDLIEYNVMGIIIQKSYKN